MGGLHLVDAAACVRGVCIVLSNAEHQFEGLAISATGPDGSSLKIRPPLPFSKPNVDQLAEALTDTLRSA